MSCPADGSAGSAGELQQGGPLHRGPRDGGPRAHALWVSLLDLALPGRCAACGEPVIGALCGPCTDSLAGQLWPDPRVTRPDPCPPGLPVVVAAAPYAGVLRMLLTAYKDKGRRDLLPLLAAVLRRPLVALGRPTRDDLVVPVPSSRAAVRRRGDSPLLALTREAVLWRRTHGVGADPVTDALHPVRRVADQAGLGHAARAGNLEGAYAVRPALRQLLAGRPVVLVDDVVTTGATLVEATRALQAAGARVEVAVTLAATPRRPRGTTRTPRSLEGERS